MMENICICIYQAVTSESPMKETVLFRTMNCTIKKIENEPINEMQEILMSISDEIKLMTRARKYSTVEVQFKNEKAAKKYARNSIKTEKRWLFSIYMGSHVVRIRVGILPRAVKKWIEEI